MMQATLPRLANVDVQATAGAGAALRRAALSTDDALLPAAAALMAGDPAALDRLRQAVSSRTIVAGYIRELREVASLFPDTGACTVATALTLWSWTKQYLQGNAEAVDELTEAVCPLLAARCFALEVALGAPEKADLSHVYAAHASAVAAGVCAELVYGYRQHLAWDAEGCASCYDADELDDLESVIPGFSCGARTTIDIIESDGSHPAKRGPCADSNGVEVFVRLRNRLDACLTGARIAKQRAAAAMARSAE